MKTVHIQKILLPSKFSIYSFILSLEVERRHIKSYVEFLIYKLMFLLFYMSPCLVLVLGIKPDPSAN